MIEDTWEPSDIRDRICFDTTACRVMFLGFGCVAFHRALEVLRLL